MSEKNSKMPWLDSTNLTGSLKSYPGNRFPGGAGEQEGVPIFDAAKAYQVKQVLKAIERLEVENGTKR